MTGRLPVRRAENLLTDPWESSSQAKSIDRKDQNMTRVKLMALTLVGCTLGLFVSIDGNRVSSVSGNTMSLEVSISKAYAQRRGRAGGPQRCIPGRCLRSAAETAIASGTGLSYLWIAAMAIALDCHTFALALASNLL